MTHALSLQEIARITSQAAPGDLARDEAFWARFAALYDRDESFVQLNYGFYHPALRPVLEAEQAMAREVNRRGSHFKWQESDALLEAARAELAALAGADPEEIVITRNATEAMNIVIQGVALARGDEVVCSDQDYPSMDQAWEQRAQAEGIVIRRARIPLDPADDEEVVRCFAAEITPRTRLLHVTHLIHLSGQVLPVARLCRLGRERGVPVLVDAAHAFAQLDFSVRALDCDYLATSLHKWLGAPLGTGMLYVRRDRISGVHPLFGDTRHAAGDIRRLEHFGNRPDALNAGLREAIRWHGALGTPAKRARLAYLQRQWAEPVRTWPRFRMLTPRAEARHGALGLCVLDGVPAETLFRYLYREHGVFTVVQKLPTIPGVRVTPGLPSSARDIARLLEGLRAAERHFPAAAG
ncbi:MAG TPA: aminotransferase class V-fold PLP-dependent enzyme [Lacunisphaera sp.]|nr:aminotransferase class V-fold PLP-dependent enzyme [Lacunisphaera sp.]